MRFAFTRCNSLPRLSWCAHMRHGSEVAHVYHGPWVETRDDWFIEGAWTGPFEEGELDVALFLVGSGAVVRAGRVVFCTQTDMIEPLYSLRAGDDLFVANSLVFVLAMAGDEPDPAYPYYIYDLRADATDEKRPKRKTFRTRRGQRVQLHEHCQLMVGSDLRIVRVEKPAFSRPGSFRGYISMLEGVLRATLDNAASSGRQHRRYEALATVSGGYDANALAALLSRQGVRDAITFYDESIGEDSGETVARCLGMTVTVKTRTAFRTTPGVDEAEFLSWPDKRSDIVLASCEEHLVGKVLAMGRHGDVVFDNSDHPVVKDFRTLSRHGGGSRMSEFRLRTGFLNFNPFYAGALHLSAMHGITTSEEMAPWRLAGRYDRPIARRILEEAGVPRGAFGTTKRASAVHEFGSPADLSPSSRADFESYRRSMPRPGLLPHALVRFRSACERGVRAIKRVWWTGGKTAESMFSFLSRFQSWDEMDFAMHWGQARVRPRYAEAVAAKASDLPRNTLPHRAHVQGSVDQSR